MGGGEENTAGIRKISWTPKVYRIIVFLTISGDFGLLFYILLGSRFILLCSSMSHRLVEFVQLGFWLKFALPCCRGCLVATKHYAVMAVGEMSCRTAPSALVDILVSRYHDARDSH